MQSPMRLSISKIADPDDDDDDVDTHYDDDDNGDDDDDDENYFKLISVFQVLTI